MVFHASVEPFRSCCLHLKTLLQNSTEEDPGTWMDRKLCWLWFVISEGSSALAAEAPSHRNPGLDVWKCLVLAGFLSLSSPVPSMLCCEATSSFGLNCMQIGFTLWHCFAHFFRQAQRARWLQDGWKIFLKKSWVKPLQRRQACIHCFVRVLCFCIIYTLNAPDCENEAWCQHSGPPSVLVLTWLQVTSG